jgi:IS4 transposase
MSLTGRHVERLRITAERVHDRRGIPFGRWVRDRLLLFDLGYFDYGLFHAIQIAGGAFLTRLKETANGTILRVRRGCARRYVGKRLNGRLYRGPAVDLDVRFGQGKKAGMFRVVGIWDAGARDYHWYVTSLDAGDFPPEEVAEIYRLRWQIELLFKEWKSLCRIDQIPSGKEPVVLCLVYASLCAALLSRIAMWLASRRYGLPWDRMCAPVATKILAAMAVPLGFALCRGRARDLRRVVALLLDAIAIHASLSNPSHVLATASRQAA